MSHATHCCKIHGCKYGDDDCSVYNGTDPGVRCEQCDWDDQDPEIIKIKKLEQEIIELKMKLYGKPIWIKVDDGLTFEGHQGHWADNFFANATKSMILLYGTCHGKRSDEKIEIREMTHEEMLKYPEAIKFQHELINEYGEC